MIEILNFKEKFRFLKNKNLMTTNNGKFLEVFKKKHAEMLKKEILEKKKFKDPYSLISLTFFSCSLDPNEINQIKQKIFDLLNFDYALFRCFDEDDLVELMDEKFNPLISDFKNIFKLELFTVDSILKFNKVRSQSLKKYLNELDVFQLTIFYKLSCLTKSVILSYFYINKKINNNTLYKLSNLEYTYQQKRWGVVKEQKEVDKNHFETIKKISFFLKNIN